MRMPATVGASPDDGWDLGAVAVEDLRAVRLARDGRHRSPLSPWPDFTLVLALLRRSAVSDFPTSSNSLNFPPAPRLTNRLSVPVSISSRFAAFFLPPVFLAAAFFAMRSSRA